MGTNTPSMPPRPWSAKPQPTRRELLWLAEGKTCHWCGRPTRYALEESGDQATIDHIVPRYKGGTDDPSNIVSSCRACNARRNSEDMKGLPEGSLLVKLVGNHTRIALTADEKKALMARIKATPVMQAKKNTEDLLRVQRDQAMTALTLLRKEHKVCEVVIKAQNEQLKSMTVWKLIKIRLVELLSCPQSGK